MVFGTLLLVALSLLALAYCALDVATSKPADVRALPKPLWFVVLLLPVVGPAAWMLAGRPKPGSGPRAIPDPGPPRTPDDDEEFLRQLRLRAEQQRREAEMQRRRESDPRDDPSQA